MRHQWASVRLRKRGSNDRLFHACIALILLAATFGLSYSMGRYDQMQIDHIGLPAPALAAGTGLRSLSRMQARSPTVMQDRASGNDARWLSGSPQAMFTVPALTVEAQ